MEAEREDTSGDIDFLAIRVTSGDEQPVKSNNDSTPAPAIEEEIDVPKKKRRESLENMVDSCISKLQKENSASDAQDDMKKRSKSWMAKKELDRKTYGRQIRRGLVPGSSPVYPGEEVSGDEEFWRRGKLPLVTADNRQDKVSRWLEGVGVDPASQPSPGQRNFSTPARGEKTPDRRFLGQKEDNLSDISPCTSHPLSPVDMNVLQNKGGRRVSMDDTVILSLGIQNSCPVEVNDTFDKMVLNGKKKPFEHLQEQEVVCSQVSSDSMPPLISPSVAVSVLKTLETSTESDDLSDLEGVKGVNGIGKLKAEKTKSSQGWKKIQTVFNDISATRSEKPKRKSKIGSLDFLEHDAKESIINENNEGKFFQEKPSPNSSVEECQGWNTQDARDVESKSIKYNKLLADEEKQIMCQPDSNIEKGHPEPSSENKTLPKPKIPFSLAGRIAPKRKQRRENIVPFVQLGCLASPRRYQLPSLRSIVAKKRAGLNKIESDKDKPILSVKKQSLTNNCITEDQTLSESEVQTPKTGSSVLKAHIDKVTKIVAAADHESCDVTRIESTCPESAIEWDINKTLVDNEEEPTFMQKILGNNDDLYSQEKETEAQQVSRVARIEFETGVEDELTKKRARSEDTDEIEEFETPKKSLKKAARIESDSDDTLDSPIGKTPERSHVPSKFRSIVAARRSRLSASSKSDLKTPRDQETVLQSRSLLDSPASKKVASRSSCASETDPKRLTTQEMERQIEESEHRARKLREEAEMLASGDKEEEDRVSDVEPMLEDALTDFIEKETSQKLLPINADIVLETETMAADQEDLSQGETKFVLESDDDMFSQTPDRPGTEVIPSQQPPLSPVQEEEEMANKKEKDMVDTRQWKFVFSGLSSSNKKIAQQFVDDLGCQGISNSVDSSVTHVVVKTGENLEAQRTLKFLQAVSSGIRIVSFLWVEACLKNKDNLNKADNWEALDEELHGANGPFRARKGREEGKKPLLAGLEVLIDGPIEGLNKPNIEDLLFRAGARTVPRVNMFSCTPGITRLVLVNNVSEYGQKEVTRMLRSFRLAVVDKDWLLDTVSSHSRRPVQQYTLDIVKRVDLMRAGYSGMLNETD